MNRKREIVDGKGHRSAYDKEKIRVLLSSLLFGLDEEHVSVQEVVDKMEQQVSDGISTDSLTDLLAETCAFMNILHPDYGVLGARVAVKHLHRKTEDSFMATLRLLYHYVDDKTQQKACLIQDSVMEVAQKHEALIEQTIDYSRDFSYDFFGYKTLEKSYLLKVNGKIVERP